MLHRKEIRRLIGAVERQGLTLIPLELYFKREAWRRWPGAGQGKEAARQARGRTQADDEREMARAVRVAMIARAALLLQLAAGSSRRSRSSSSATASTIDDACRSCSIDSAPSVRADALAEALGGRAR